MVDGMMLQYMQSMFNFRLMPCVPLYDVYTADFFAGYPVAMHVHLYPVTIDQRPLGCRVCRDDLHDMNPTCDAKRYRCYAANKSLHRPRGTQVDCYFNGLKAAVGDGGCDGLMYSTTRRSTRLRRLFALRGVKSRATHTNTGNRFPLQWRW